MIIENEDIICISSIDWDFIWQGHQEIMSTFAKNGNRVLFINNTGVRSPNLSDVSRVKKRIKDWWRSYKGFKKELDNLYIYSPVVLPFPYSRIARFINKLILLRSLKCWMRSMDFMSPIVWTFLPTGTALDLIAGLDKKLLVYYCIDSFVDSSSSAKKIAKTEKKLICQSDEVFVTSKNLYDYCKKYSDKVSIFPFGVNVEQFEAVRNSPDLAIPDDLKGINAPIVGYIGGIHKWLDQDLIRDVALERPDYAFVMVGPVQTDISKLKDVSNIHFLGAKDHACLPLYIYFFDICWIPYLVTDYTNNVYPTKLNEYLAMGKAVLSTRLPEIERINIEDKDIVMIGDSIEDFVQNIDNSNSGKTDIDLVNKRIGFASENTWGKRINQMCELMAKRMEENRRQQGEDWVKGMRGIVRSSQRNFILILFIVGILYVSLFHSPLVWIIAEPLKINDTPVKAEAIVVFGGGVGESSMPGQGTWERVDKGVELYKQGCGEYVVMMTGYRYVYKEGEVLKLSEAGVMKNLAVSMGVQEDNIVMAKNVASTYEYVESLNNILEEKEWNSVLIVSSPYHMRRTELVVNNLMHSKKVYYVPTSENTFFGNRGRVQWKHIRAIAREYLAIVYYWYKGYI